MSYILRITNHSDLIQEIVLLDSASNLAYEKLGVPDGVEVKVYGDEGELTYRELINIAIYKPFICKIITITPKITIRNDGEKIFVHHTDIFKKIKIDFLTGLHLTLAPKECFDFKLLID